VLLCSTSVLLPFLACKHHVSQSACLFHHCLPQTFQGLNSFSPLNTHLFARLFVWVALVFELGASCLLGRCSMTWPCCQPFILFIYLFIYLFILSVPAIYYENKVVHLESSKNRATGHK
jgi:hypothetical protein